MPSAAKSCATVCDFLPEVGEPLSDFISRRESLGRRWCTIGVFTAKFCVLCIAVVIIAGSQVVLVHSCSARLLQRWLQGREPFDVTQQLDSEAGHAGGKGTQTDKAVLSSSSV